MRLPHISLIAAVFAYFSNRISHIFSHKLALFDGNFNIICVFITHFYQVSLLTIWLPTPSMCLDPSGTRWGSWFHALLYHISAYFRRIFSVYAVFILFFKESCIKLTCLERQSTEGITGYYRAYSKRVPHTNCALRIKKCAPRISSGICFLSTS